MNHPSRIDSLEHLHRYTLGNWNNRACVRADHSDYVLAADLEQQLGTRHWFVPTFMPYLEHPDIQNAGRSLALRLEANHLVYFLDYTTLLEHKIVNRAVETLIHSELGIPIPQEMKTAALQLYTDEGYHALFSNEVAEQVAQLYDMRNRPFMPHRVQRLLALVEAGAPDDRALLWFLIGFVSETVIAKELLNAARNTLVSTVFTMLKSHLNDEARHSRYFCEVFCYIWPRLTPRQRSDSAKQLLVIMGIFFESDRSWLRKSLSSVDLKPATIEQIVTQLQQPHAHQQRVRSGANATLFGLTRAGFFDTYAHRRLFAQAGFIDG